jgi:3-oxoacyl-[acyl-carrier-protein] synthase-3
MPAGQVARTTGVRISGVVSCIPPRAIGNEYFVAQFGDKALDVTKMTGVQTRYWVEGQTTSDLCEQAAERLLSGLEWDRDSVDAIIFVSQTPDYRLPATGCTLQARLQMRPGIIAFDVGLGCSGYPYGLWLASMMIQTGAARRVLLAVGDTSSLLVDPEDRATALLFGDAGTVTALEADETAGESVFILGSDGAGAENLIVPEGAFRGCGGQARFEGRPLDKLYMDGGEIFNFTLKAVPGLIKETAAAAGHELEDYDSFLLHQANAFMIKHLAKKARLPPEKVPINIDRYGNTSSATIPLLMTSDVAAVLRERECRLALFGFGVGYSWASASIQLGPLRCAETINYAV